MIPIRVTVTDSLPAESASVELHVGSGHPSRWLLPGRRSGSLAPVPAIMIVATGCRPHRAGPGIPGVLAREATNHNPMLWNALVPPVEAALGVDIDGDWTIGEKVDWIEECIDTFSQLS